MPLYEFRCQDCGLKFEKIRKFSEPDANCPKCLIKAIRLISVPGPAIVPGGTHAGRSSTMTLGEMPDRNEWIDQ